MVVVDKYDSDVVDVLFSCENCLRCELEIRLPRYQRAVFGHQGVTN
jgi:hypothetical protein